MGFSRRPIVVGATVLNAVRCVGKAIGDIRINMKRQ